MRTNHHAFAALDAGLLVPHRYLESEVPLFVAGGSGLERAIGNKRAYWQLLAAISINQTERVRDGLRGFVRERRRQLSAVRSLARNFDLEQIRKRLVDGSDVLLHNFLALFAVSLLN